MAEKEKSIKQDKTRAKDWTFVAYPESLPSNWIQIMQERFEVSKAIISPLHDKDKNDDVERTDKKPHYHVILRYGSMKSFSQIREITDALKQRIPQKVKNIEGAVRYLVHIDNPDKAQYNQSDIRVIGNVDIERYFTRTAAEEDGIHAEMIEYIKVNDITEFADLMDYALAENYDWFRFLCRHTYVIDKYITSRRNKKEQQTSPKSIAKALSMLLYGEIK